MPGETSFSAALSLPDGSTMPALGLGTWNSEPGEVYHAVTEALLMGYRHIDCAFIYGNEVEIGEAFRDVFQKGIVDRKEVWITSKLWNDSHGLDDVQPALEKSLKNLQLDYLDLYLVHWPVAIKKGLNRPDSGDDMISLEEIPLAETWRGMETVARKGLCRFIGVSNYSVAKLQALLKHADVKPLMNQVEMHPYLQQPALLDFCDSNGMYLTAYSPLGSPNRPTALKVENEPVLLKDPVILEIASNHSVNPAQILISWALHRTTSVIPKSVNPVRLKQNLGAIDVRLTTDDMDAINSLDRHRRYIDGSFWAVDGSPYTVADLWDE